MLIPSSSKSWIGKYITLHLSKTNPTLGLRPRVGLVYSRESLYIFQSNFLNWMGLPQRAGVILTQSNCPGKNSFRIHF